ncbi:uncharacterized protein TRIVIDRAFT_221518 [Trichoderma virens Gv29-8]|uniref:mRNA stability protein n=1 Tax=Hypocrea virens (strain Gv29-8 / FGSC 10586) TaxID=413071 RepID=G9MSS2_HYPVG|nr:uncharacterized protein TRIVIDRAFT_221518 [Trichoderma virens Gv29-8]EHK22232.1 hypothetical protein TRIVIDRAFT_221518 [Trichoderma virens Gv29-8]UKZ47272.1 hypothetical protein TrVGV298_001489 [Trichoderma virens]
MEPKREETKRRDSDREAHLRKIYGTLPNRGQLLDHQLEKRTFFDSGDFALSKARRSSSMGSVTTGSEHPNREGISQPFCPVPGLSNLERSNSREQKKGEDICKSHLSETQSSKKS